jgi:3D (Asp-Asp-Asp) domain-containing protein
MNILDTIKYRKSEIAVLLVLVFELSFPHFAVAAEPQTTGSIMLPSLVIRAADSGNSKVALIAPVQRYQVVKTYNIPITAYSSTVDQCDSTPCLTANDFNLCEHNQEDVIAANFLPFGTKVRIPEYFGDQVFTVVDRMNARYYYRADIWMKTREAAQKFGIVYTTIEVLE